MKSKLLLLFLPIIILASSVSAFLPDADGNFPDDYFDFKGSYCYCYDKIPLTDARFIAFSLSCNYDLDTEDNSNYNMFAMAKTESDYNNLEKKRIKIREDKELMDAHSKQENIVDYSIEGDTIYLIQKYSYEGVTSYSGEFIMQYDDQFYIAIRARGLDYDPADDFKEITICMGDAIEKAKASRALKDSEEETKDGNYGLTFSIENRPLKNMHIQTNAGDYFTNDLGKVNIKGDIRWIDINFKYVSDTPVFYLSSPEGELINLDVRVDDGIIEKLSLEVNNKDYGLKIVDKKLKNFKIEDYTGQIASHLYNYLYFQDAVEYYDSLGVEFTEPVKIIIHNAYKNKAAYITNEIHLDKTMASPLSPQAPYTQYHEFAHFVMDTLYGDVFAKIVKEKNHGGYANPSTADSWAEGFAAFMAVQTANYHDHYWAKYPSEKNPALYPFAGSLETNYQAWAIEGRAEEFAIASFLWDLVDDEKDIVDTQINSGLDLVFALHFKSADGNYDGLVTKEEFVLMQLRESGNAVELDEVDWLGMIDYGKVLSGKYDVTPDLSLFEKHKGDDEVLSFDELISLADIMKYEFKDDVAKEWMFAYDEDKDKQISLGEAKKLLEGYEIIKILSEDYDFLELEDLEVLSKDPVIQDAYWTFEKDEYTYEELFKELTANMIRKDDENLNMDFNVLWDIMMNKHRDFNSFIDELSESNDVRYQEKLAYSLLDHSLYADLTEGNKVYDKGIEAFVDTNNDGIRQDTEKFIDYPTLWNFDGLDHLNSSTNYQRPARKSSPVFAGHFVPGATEVAYLIWDGPVLKDYFLVRTDGYVPIPPGVSVYAANEDSIVHFSEKAFTQNYEEIKERGYITTIKEKKSRGWIFILLILIVVIGIVKKKSAPKKGKKKKRNDNKEELKKKVKQAHTQVKEKAKHTHKKIKIATKKGVTNVKQFYDTKGKKMLKEAREGSKKAVRGAVSESKKLHKKVKKEFDKRKTKKKEKL